MTQVTGELCALDKGRYEEEEEGMFGAGGRLEFNTLREQPKCRCCYCNILISNNRLVLSCLASKGPVVVLPSRIRLPLSLPPTPPPIPPALVLFEDEDEGVGVGVWGVLQCGSMTYFHISSSPPNATAAANTEFPPDSGMEVQRMN